MAESRPGLLAVDAALKTILSAVRPLGSERVPLREALGRVLAADLCAPRDVPPWDNSSVDGYAVRAANVASADQERPAALAVIEEIPAGCMPTRTVSDGQASRIMTGAPMPAGADAVVMVEDTTLDGERVLVRAAAPVGDSVRRRGQDVRAGAIVVSSGRRLRPADVGMAASLGYAAASVGRRPRVGILATGDELIDVGEPERSDRLYDVNSYAIAAQVAEAGSVAVALGIARDTPAAVRAALSELDGLDALIVCGGVSVGKFDFVKDVLTELGMTMEFWRVAMKPGSPMAFGSIRGRPVFGLPGNPVSSMVTFEVFVRPALLRMAGATVVDRPVVAAELSGDVEKSPGKTHFVRARLWRDGARLRAAPTGSQDSGVLTSMVKADGLMVLDRETGRATSGQIVDVRLLHGEGTGEGAIHGV
ncbi:MAG: gephyrin-like molybdotransferase Glp [Nitrospirota bacterium]